MPVYWHRKCGPIKLDINVEIWHDRVLFIHMWASLLAQSYNLNEIMVQTSAMPALINRLTFSKCTLSVLLFWLLCFCCQNHACIETSEDTSSLRAISYCSCHAGPDVLAIQVKTLAGGASKINPCEGRHFLLIMLCHSAKYMSLVLSISWEVLRSDVEVCKVRWVFPVL